MRVSQNKRFCSEEGVDYPVINGLKLNEMLLEDWQQPDRDALIAEMDQRRVRSKKATHRRSVA